MNTSFRIFASVVCFVVLLSGSAFGFYQIPDHSVLIQTKLDDARDKSIANGTFEWAELTERTEYFISETLVMHPNVGLRGRGMDRTTIYSLPSLGTGKSIYFVDDQNTRLMDLCLKPLGTQHRIIEMTRSPSVKMIRVRIEDYHEPVGTHANPMFAVLVLENCDGIEIVNCEFLNMSMESDITDRSLRVLKFGGEGGLGIAGAVVRDCLFENIYAIGGVFTSARDADAIVTSYSHGGAFIRIEGNTFINAGKRAVKDKSDGLTIINNVMIFEDEFYAANYSPGRICDPSESIGLQILGENDNPSTITGNIIYGNFINAAIRVGTREYTLVSENVISVPPDIPNLNIYRWSDRDGMQLKGLNANDIDVVNNSFVGNFRWGITRYGFNSVNLVNTRFLGTREGIIGTRYNP